MIPNENETVLRSYTDLLLLNWALSTENGYFWGISAHPEFCNVISHISGEQMFSVSL